MHILFIAPRLPLPADTGGKIRTLNILRQLAQKARVHLACFSFEHNDQKWRQGLEKDHIGVTLVPAKDPALVALATQILFNQRPASIAKYYSRPMEQSLARLNKTNRFDAVHFDHLHMTHYRNIFNGIPCVLDEHNVEYRILERCADVEKFIVKKMVFQNQARKMKRFETLKLRELPVHLAVSSDDLAMLGELDEGRNRGYVIPNGVDTEHFRTQDVRPKTQEEEAVVFTGSMDWLPNSDSAVYFIEDILPLIWKQRPQVKFYVVGKNPPPGLAQYARQDERIIVTGCIEDVRVYVRRAKVFVVPLRIGGGTRLKILEAMSMQKAVVSTSIGAEGIEYSDDRNIVIADEPPEFARKVIALLDDPRKREILGNAGRALVLEKYDWNIIGKRLVNIYEQITRKKQS